MKPEQSEQRMNVLVRDVGNRTWRAPVFGERAYTNPGGDGTYSLDVNDHTNGALTVLGDCEALDAVLTRMLTETVPNVRLSRVGTHRNGVRKGYRYAPWDLWLIEDRERSGTYHTSFMADYHGTTLSIAMLSSFRGFLTALQRATTHPTPNGA